jgi:hypothetical protein
MMVSEGVTDAAGERKQSFLMLNDQSIEFVDGAPVLGYWVTTRRWDAKAQKAIQMVDGIAFAMDKKFWEMIDATNRKHSVKSEVRVQKDGRLYYRGKPVELGLEVGRLDSVLRWHDWIVAVGTAADTTRSTIKGPIWYLFWFGEKDLKGSYRQVSTVGAPPLRIFSK